ncbi:DNA-binding transcriptional activator of the SARP family [Streptomyces sp. yr375]|uniref:AfsR/SARP family transcriptional regulator n=1 Tax=Streptomyces sp. yr375 TaxID=1761906 RepID=UPI0008CC3709|nr:BTAD domain-containing putative transcriptional regulator [Streptomyces sp. yr375]SEP58885.1 DNA-binding transcriptional activator of the SARP family [Streptomyces sp. yr375]
MAATGAPLRIQLLGPVRAWRHGVEVALGPPKQRAVLGLLASRAGDVVGVENIVDALWGGDVPQTAANGVHTYVGGLRRALDPGRGRRAAGALLTSASGGYCLRLDPSDVDATLFVRGHGDARRSRGEGNADTTLRLYEQALSLWHGEAYSGVPGPFASMERTRLRDLRLTAVEEWAADMLAAGRHAEMVTELTGAVSEEPLREKLRWLLILALYRSGRQAHALRMYEETRQLLSSELGIEPGADLRNLYQRILSGHPELRPPGADTPPVPLTGRETAFPGAPKPVQLPPLARGFVGRGKELSGLEGVLNDECSGHGATTPVAVVDGPAGVGKSAFVLELAHRLIDRFPDGQLYVDLRGTGLQGRPVSAVDALGQLLGSLGIDGSRMPRGLAARATLYRSLLHGRRMLVVLDDALSADQLRPLIPRGSSCVLATSRQRFGGLAARDGAHLVSIGPLADAESARLLAGLSGGRLEGQEPATACLAALCGGLPLALRIVADGLAANPGVPLSALVEQYAAERGRLDRLAVKGDAVASMRSVFEASYQALPADAARMFRHLGLYGGPFTVGIAATLAETDRDTTRRLLALLAAHHLLEEEQGHRYRFHSLIGIYAAECADREPPARRQEALTRLLRAGDGRADPEPPGRAGPQASRPRAVLGGLVQAGLIADGSQGHDRYGE